MFRIPSAIPFIFRDLCWNIPADDKVIYLTFDDGPEPAVTPFVLDLLKKYKASATFFCIGKNAVSNPELYQRLLDEGHAVGNHSFSHLKGWNTDSETYLEDIRSCESVVDSKLFRPPYGRITFRQYRQLRKEYTIVFWDVITHDYEPGLDKSLALSKSINAIRPGSVVVFHDSLKAKQNLEFMLPRIMEHFHLLGFRFDALTESLCKRAIS